ncbi:nuclease [Maribacter sp. 4G9]|nr:nuclease [Maribacter sp. 4G9]
MVYFSNTGYRFINKGIPLLMALAIFACVNNKDFEVLRPSCDATLTANTGFQELKEYYQGETVQIQEDWVIEGYVISSDRENNFFNVLYFQNSPNNPNDGLQIEIDMRDSHLFYEVGDKILIKLKGLYLGVSRNQYKIGGVFTSFGNVSVGRLPYNQVFEHVFVACEGFTTVTPDVLTIPDVRDTNAGTLVQLEDLEFSMDELGRPFAEKEEETERILVDCEDNELVLLNSGFADFQSVLLPENRGSITGVLVKDGNDFKLVIRDLDDVDFKQERCEDFVDEFTANSIFFSELADPDNNPDARFVEIYNSSTESLSLKGWQILRYTNDSETVSSSTDLSGYVIDGESTLLLSPNPLVFEQVYGFPPNVDAGTNSPADSNGDDNLVLVDPFGKIIDTFGVPGEDGTGTVHEFEDGRAQRKLEVLQGSPVYQFSQWEIFNDSGDAGTINLPQLAPGDFTPGIR